MKITHIDKEEILDLNFPKEDVLGSRNERTSRWLQLKRASYGEGSINNPRKKLQKDKAPSQRNIIFKSMNNGVKSVKSRILRTKTDCVILAGGYTIPMRCIYQVE